MFTIELWIFVFELWKKIIAYIFINLYSMLLQRTFEVLYSFLLVYDISLLTWIVRKNSVTGFLKTLVYERNEDVEPIH